MINRFAFFAILLLSAPSPALADEVHTFPESGKTYTLHRFGNENAYIYEQGNLLYAGTRSNTQKQFWQFVPTGRDNCYYVQNVTSKRYVQSSSTSVDAQIETGAAPVEFQIVKNTSGESTAGYYYLCSTDQDIDNSKDGTLGLNFQASTGKVVAYHIRYNRANSYWDIQESEYAYETIKPAERSALSKRLGIYNQPCGLLGTAWLRSCSITGESVANELAYDASTMPTDYWTLVRTDSAGVVRGGKFTLTYVAEGFTEDHTATAYFDWDADGIFETRHDFFAQAEGSAEIEVPPTAATRRVRMRLRLTDNTAEDAEDDVHGTVYDFQIFTAPRVPSDPSAIATPAEVLEKTDGAAYGIDGKRVIPDSHRGVVILNGMKKIK